MTSEVIKILRQKEFWEARIENDFIATMSL